MNNFFKLIISIALFFLLFGCTSQDILLVRQTIGADINGFFDGNYDGAIPFVDFNQIVFEKDFNFKDNIFYAPLIAGDLNWVYLDNYPASCPSGTAVQSIGDTLTCVALSDTNGFVTWLDANATFVPFTGTTKNVVLGDFNLLLNKLEANILQAKTSAGGHITSHSGSVVADFGTGGGNNWTFYDGVKLNAGDANKILYLDTSKNITYSNMTNQELLDLNNYVYNLTFEDTNLQTFGVFNTDNNSLFNLTDVNALNVKTRIVYSDWNDMWGTIYCADGNIITGFIYGFSC